MKQFVSGAGQSLNENARKLVSSMSQDSNGTNEVPNIEVSEEINTSIDSNGQEPRKKHVGSMLVPSPEVVASMPLSPGVHFSRRRPSLGLSPSGVTSVGKRSPFAITLDAPANSLTIG